MTLPPDSNECADKVYIIESKVKKKKEFFLYKEGILNTMLLALLLAAHQVFLAFYHDFG